MHLDASDFAGLDDTQRTAILETMVVGLIADNQITAPEVRRFDEIVLALPWGVERDVLVGMIRGAKERLSSLQTPQAIKDYVVGLATRLPDPALRDKVVFTMATLMLAEQGDLLLNDPIGNYLPQLKDMKVSSASGPVAARRQPTLQDMLRHTAGVTYGNRGDTALHKLYASKIRGADDMTSAQ